MNRLKTIFFLMMYGLATVVSGYSQYWSVDNERIIFSTNTVTKGVTWSKNFMLTPEGLETKKLPTTQSQDVWVQTHAFPVALALRPPRYVKLTLYFDGLVNQVEGIAMQPQFFVRYSCDKKNWSTWYTFGRTEKKSEIGSDIYETILSLPDAAWERIRTL